MLEKIDKEVEYIYPRMIWIKERESERENAPLLSSLSSLFSLSLSF